VELASVAALTWLLFFTHLGEKGLFLDAATYAVVARNCLRLGAWLTPHYTTQYYPQFFQHPPLGLWMEAALFRVAGASDASVHLFGGLCAAATVAGIWRLAAQLAGRTAGWIASLLFLTAAPVCKWIGGGLLEAPLLVFLVWGSVALVHAVEGESWRSYAAAGGLCACAILVKGVEALGLVAACALAWYAASRRRSSTRFGLLFLLGGALAAAAPIAGALLHANGGAGLRSYLAHLTAKLGGEGGTGRGAFLRYILVTGWPSLPVDVVGLVQLLRSRWSGSVVPAVLLGHLAYYIVTFTVSPAAHPYHIVCVFPWLAVAGGFALRRVLPRILERTAWAVLAAATAGAVVLAVAPIRVHARRAESFVCLAPLVRSTVPAGGTILMEEGAQPYWDEVAYAAWYLDREAEIVPFDSLIARWTVAERWGSSAGARPVLVSPRHVRQALASSNASFHVIGTTRDLVLLGDHGTDRPLLGADRPRSIDTVESPP
jgi:4-amino-4-deoxy-L-arabinose transferase-like glycosyltransferase